MRPESAWARSCLDTRTRCVVVATPCWVALTTPATDAPVRSSTRGQQEEDEQDVRADVGEEVAGRPEKRLARETAVVAQVFGVEEPVASRVAGPEAE